MDDRSLEALVRQVVREQLQKQGAGSGPCTLRQVSLPAVSVSEADRLDTGRAGDIVYTHDLFTLDQSPRLGAGIMEMRATSFPWTLNYDEVDYVIQGRLDVTLDGRTVSAGPGELIFIPKGSSITFSVPDFARFLYVTYPADWQGQ